MYKMHSDNISPMYNPAYNRHSAMCSMFSGISIKQDKTEFKQLKANKGYS